MVQCPSSRLSFLAHIPGPIRFQVSLHPWSCHILGPLRLRVCSHPEPPHSGSRPPVWTPYTHSPCDLNGPLSACHATYVFPDPSTPPCVLSPGELAEGSGSYLSSLRASRLYGLSSCGIRKSSNLVIM